MRFVRRAERTSRVHHDDAFTLIELLIVIVVLGILAAVVVFSLGNVNHTAKQSACFDDAKTIETAVSAYNAQNTTPIAVELTTGADTVTMTSTAGISVGQTLADVTHPGTTTPVVSVVDATHLTVAAGTTLGYTNGDTISINAVSKGAASFTASGVIVPGTPATYSGPNTQAAKLVAGLYLRSWPTGLTSSGYAMSLSTTVPGDVALYIPATSSTPIDFETESSSSGCNSSLL